MWKLFFGLLLIPSLVFSLHRIDENKLKTLPEKDQEEINLIINTYKKRQETSGVRLRTLRQLLDEELYKETVDYIEISNLGKKLMNVYRLRVDNKVDSVKKLRKILDPVQFIDVNTSPVPKQKKQTIKRKTLFGL
ncbi:hypothetical protein HOG98_02155 [bacterium]|jgi:hypothetical protein|nr:hypothetical protein [bacterium]